MDDRDVVEADDRDVVEADDHDVVEADDRSTNGRAVARVVVQPSGIEFDVDLGTQETAMGAAERHGFSWPTTCHGIAECRTCIMYVLDDDVDGCVAPPNLLEQQALDTMSFSLQGAPERWRLACQAVILADVTVRKPGVRPAE